MTGVREHYPRSRQLIQQRLGLLQVRRIETFGEPTVDWCEQIAGFRALALVMPEPGEADRCPQLEQLCALPLGNDDGLTIVRSASDRSPAAFNKSPGIRYSTSTSDTRPSAVSIIRAASARQLRASGCASRQDLDGTTHVRARVERSIRNAAWNSSSAHYPEDLSFVQAACATGFTATMIRARV
jgi:hypothetical protein